MTTRVDRPDQRVDANAPDRVRIEAWPDAVIDELGFNPEPPRPELAWLPQLGPAALLAWRLLAAAVDDCPDGFELDLADFARTLGLPPGLGHDSPVVRTLRRLVVFDLAVLGEDRTYRVRRRAAGAGHAGLRASYPVLSPPARHRLRDRIERGQRRPRTPGAHRAARAWLLPVT